MQELNFNDQSRLLAYLQRFGLLGGGEITPEGRDLYAELNYSQPTPMGLLDIGVTGSSYKDKDYSQTDIDGLKAMLTRGGLSFSAETDKRGKNPVFGLQYEKQF